MNDSNWTAFDQAQTLTNATYGVTFPRPRLSSLLGRQRTVPAGVAPESVAPEQPGSEPVQDLPVLDRLPVQDLEDGPHEQVAVPTTILGEAVVDLGRVESLEATLDELNPRLSLTFNYIVSRLDAIDDELKNLGGRPSRDQVPVPSLD